MTLADLSQFDERDISLVDFDLGLDDRHVGDGQQDRPGIVHRANHHVLALLDVAAGDDAVEGRLEARLRQRVLAAHESSLLLTELFLARLDLLFPRPQLRLAHVHIGLRPLEGFARGQAGLPQVLLPLEALARDFELRLRALERHPRLFEAGARTRHGSLIAPDRTLHVDRVNLEEKLTGPDAVPLVHRQAGDAAHRLRADVHRLFRLDLPGGRHDRLEVTLLNRLAGDTRPLRGPSGEIGRRSAGDHEEREDCPEPFLPAEHDFDPSIHSC